MVQISALVTLFAMGSSIMASPMVKSGSRAVDVDVNVMPRAAIGASLTKPAASGSHGGPNVGDIASTIIDIATTVGKAVWDIQDDIQRRQAYTRDVAMQTAAQFPGSTVVVCNVGYSLTGSGWQQVTGVTFDAQVGSPVTYDVVVFDSPKTFKRQGDGGYQNWAYVLGPNCTGDGATVTC